MPRPWLPSMVQGTGSSKTVGGRGDNGRNAGMSGAPVLGFVLGHGKTHVSDNAGKKNKTNV